MTVVTPISEDDSPTEQHRLLHAAADGDSSMQAATSPTAACNASASHRPLWRRDDKSPRSSSSSSHLSSPTARFLPFSRSAPNTPFQPIVHKLTVFSSPASTTQSPAIGSYRLRVSAPSTPSSRTASASSWSAVLLLWCSRLFFVAPWLLLLCLLLSRFDVGLPWLLRSHPLQSPSPSLPPPVGPVPALPSSRRLYRSLAQYRIVHSAPPAPHLEPTEDHTRTALTPLPPAVAAAPPASPPSAAPRLPSPPPITNLRSQGQFLEEVQQRKVAQAAADRREEQLHPRGPQREQEAAALLAQMKSRLLEDSTAAAAAMAIIAAAEAAQEKEVVAVQEPQSRPAVKDRNDKQLQSLLRYRTRRPAMSAA